MLHLHIGGRKGNFFGEGISPERMGEVRQGEFVRHFGFTKYAITCYSWTLVEGEFFPGDGVCPRRTSGGSLTVSSKLLNMLLHVRPGRWWRGNFLGEGVRFGRFSGANGGCLYVNSN